jgi:DNA polymerase I
LLERAEHQRKLTEGVWAVVAGQVVQGVTVVRDVRSALNALWHDKELAVDIETSGLSPFRDKVAVVSLYGDESSVLAVLHVRGLLPQELADFLGSPDRRQVYHNGVGFDVPFLMEAGVDFERVLLYDTLTGATVVTGTGRRDTSMSLRAEVGRRLGTVLKKGADHSGWMNPALTEDQVRYCAEDIVHLHGLRRAQVTRAEETRQLAALELEMAIVPSVARMTHHGLPIDLEQLDGYLEDQLITARQLERELTTELGEVVNYNSPTQVLAACRRYGLVLANTQAKYLETLVADGVDPNLPEDRREQQARGLEVLGRIVAVRQAKKRLSSYSPTWVEKHVVDHGQLPGTRTGHWVHSRFWQCSTDTGRFSSSDPNLQQVPVRPPAPNMRPIFRHPADSGLRIVKVDYSQIEVVIAAYQARDRALLDLIESGGDIHTLVASQIFRVAPDQVSKYQRQLSKAANFCLIFGGGAKTFAAYARQYGAPITLPDAQGIRTEYFRQFTGLARVRDEAYELQASGRRAVNVYLPSGLRRTLIGEDVKATKILNTRVQGTAAAGMKAAIRLARARGLDMYFGATVHDELVAAGVPAEWAEDYARELAAVMVEGMQTYVRTKVGVESSVGVAWS